MFERAPDLLDGTLSDDEARTLLHAVGFEDWESARLRLREVCPDAESRQVLAESLPMLLMALSDTAVPDRSLVNFERFVQAVPNRLELFRYLWDHPRAVEILIKLFVGSQFLTEILLRNPAYLDRLTQHKRVAEFKSREQMFSEAQASLEDVSGLPKRFDALRVFQQWELLRIGACDSFGLMDLKTVTVQLSLLADSLVQSCLALLSAELNASVDGFCVLAMGKLGGEELNYSSDIDLVFIADERAPQFWTLGQRLIKSLIESTGEGFLYRVDMRLRPWGRSGPLVTSTKAYLDYLRQHGMLWEKQALVKARPIAGDAELGRGFLKDVQPIIFEAPVEAVRASVREMKSQIEAELGKRGQKWGQVKAGAGSIRDIEFVTQFLQLAHGDENPHVRSINTLDGLVRLADFGYIKADEFRLLTTGYIFLRTIEHALQLMHHKQTHALPTDRRELNYLARRLDFSDGQQFVTHYDQYCEAIRAIYERYLGDRAKDDDKSAPVEGAEPFQFVSRMEPSYSATFTAEEIDRHARLLEKLSESNLVELEAVPLDGGYWRVTIVGLDAPGDLSMICGLLFVHGFDIVDGNVFTDEQLAGVASTRSRRFERGALQSDGLPSRRFVDVFTVRHPKGLAKRDDWTRYEGDLSDLLQQIVAGSKREAQGQLAKLVAGAVQETSGTATHLLPVEVDIDNEASPTATVLHIRAEDTIGFLYELTNALALVGISIERMIVRSLGDRVDDRLYVTDASGGKISDPDRQRELRAAVVLIKHFTHLLPHSPNPESALLHFGEFLEQLFDQPNWLEELSSLEQSDVLDALARLLGVSDFLWHDFLRLQHSNLFPVVRDVEALARAKSYDELHTELWAELEAAEDLQAKRDVLNAFKDREMFREDMRHILGHVSEFGAFSRELTQVAEVTVEAAFRICEEELRERYGSPQLEGRRCPLSICALGKCGGRELGFASDIELMFLYEGPGKTSGPASISNAEFCVRLVESFTQTIQAKREGIFHIDLRLRPYGRAGSLAVSFAAFEKYFAPHGAAWPYERQALVKLRPIAGDKAFGERIVMLRDMLVYTGEPFDVAAMRAMREKQVQQLVKAGTTNAKLSPGGLVDTEYLVQGLQIAHAHRDLAIRQTNTLAAMEALEAAGILSSEHHKALREAYIFQRQLIDALRMVRGDARDLTVPDHDSEEFEFLARRVGYDRDLNQLRQDLEKYSGIVQDLGRLLDEGA